MCNGKNNVMEYLKLFESTEEITKKVLNEACKKTRLHELKGHEIFVKREKPKDIF